MKFNFKPKDVRFYKLFIPVTEKTEVGAKILKDMFDSPLEDHVKKAKEIRHIEREADTQKMQILKNIASTFVTPFDRDDLFMLCSQLENSIDLINETSELVLTMKMTSEEYPNKVKKQARILVRCAELTTVAAKGLNDLNSLDFYYKEMRELEKQADKIRRSLLTSLFTKEKDPIRLLKVKEIAEHLEMTIDSFYEITRILENILLNDL
jgi:predicted phosphate transport protein (TIGR00153 family)